MNLEGIHHITAMTADAPRNVEFYAGTLGLRLVKKTVNQDDPTVYHLFYGDEEGSPGLDLTFFEYPGIDRGRAGAGMVHRILWRVRTEESLRFWAERLRAEGAAGVELSGASLRFEDPEGLSHEVIASSSPDAPLTANAPDIPAEHALTGFEGVRAYSADPARSESLLIDAMGFEHLDEGRYESRGEERGSLYIYDAPPAERGLQGAGTVHHVAWASRMEDHEDWRRRVADAGMQPTPVIDRFYFRSVYYREPSGVLFELATIGPGFAVDEPADELGEHLSLPPRFEQLRDRLDGVLTPLPDPRRERAGEGVA